METPTHNTLVSFCTARRGFVFDTEVEAVQFIGRFDALLFLEPVIKRATDGRFLVAVEEIETEYTGD